MQLNLLLTDAGLPGINGSQFAEMMCKCRPGLKVLLMGGYAHEATVNSEFLGEGIDMLGRPFTIDALVHKVTAMWALSARLL